jgi:hypothetical protein
MDKIKQTITVICLLLMAALFCVQTVSAGSMNAGDSFDTATEIEPGFYEDELTLAEEKYSYIVVKPGQELVFGLTLDKIYGRNHLGHIDVAVFDEDRSQITRIEVKEANTKPFHFSTSSKKDSYKFYIKIDLIQDCGEIVNADYHTTISVEDHFDANSETDAGGTFNDALSISSGKYEGKLARTENSGNDRKDYYRLSIRSGDKVNVALTPSGEERLTLSIYNEDRECVKTEKSKEAGSIARTQWLADSSQHIYILVDGTYRKLPSSTIYRGGDYTLDITTGKAPAHKPGTTSGSETESKSEEQPGFAGIIAIISLAGVYIGLRKK